MVEKAKIMTSAPLPKWKGFKEILTLMKLSRIATFVLSIGALMSVAETAKAEEYAFNRNIGKVYIETVNVVFAKNGVTLSTSIHTPSCPNQHHVNGYVRVTYRNNGGFASRTWTFNGSDEENRDQVYSDFVPYRQTPGGTVNVETNAECIYHGIRHGGINLPW